METITLTKGKPTSGEISKHLNRYIDIDVKRGVVILRLTEANGSSIDLSSLVHGNKIKWDLITYVKIEFVSDDAVIDYRLFP